MKHKKDMKNKSSSSPTHHYADNRVSPALSTGSNSSAMNVQRPVKNEEEVVERLLHHSSMVHNQYMGQQYDQYYGQNYQQFSQPPYYSVYNQYPLPNAVEDKYPVEFYNIPRQDPFNNSTGDNSYVEDNRMSNGLNWSNTEYSGNAEPPTPNLTEL